MEVKKTTEKSIKLVKVGEQLKKELEFYPEQANKELQIQCFKTAMAILKKAEISPEKGQLAVAATQILKIATGRGDEV